MCIDSVNELQNNDLLCRMILKGLIGYEKWTLSVSYIKFCHMSPYWCSVKYKQHFNVAGLVGANAYLTLW